MFYMYIGNNKSSWPPKQGDQSEPYPTATPLYIPPENLLRSDQQGSAFRSLRSNDTDSIEQTVSEEQISSMTNNKRMSICSSEVSALSETRDQINPMDTVMEDSDRPMSPIPFKDEISNSVVKSEIQKSISQEVSSSSQKMESSYEGNVQTIRKTKVEESFESSSRMYSAEIAKSSQVVAMHESVRSETPELEQIMEKRFASIQQQGRPMTPTSLAMMRRLEAQPARCLTPELEHLMDKPHGTYSPLPPASVMRPLTPSQVVVFPPEFPPLQPIPPRSQPSQMQHARQVVSESLLQESRDGNIITSERQMTQFSEGSMDSSAFNKRTSVTESAPYVMEKRQSVAEMNQEKRQSISEAQQGKRQSISESGHEKRQSISETMQGKWQSISESGQEKRQSISEASRETRQSISEPVQEKRQSLAGFIDDRQSLTETVQEKVQSQISSSEQIITKTQVEEIIKQELNKILAQEKIYSGIISTSTGLITDAMTIAPDRPFTPGPPPQPIALPQPVPLPPESSPYYPPAPPPEVQYQRPAYTVHTASCASPMLQALTIAPDRPYSPLPSAFKPIEEPPPEPPKPQISMISALTTAPETPYHLLGASESTETKGTESISKPPEPVQKYVTKPTTGAFRPISSDKRPSLSDVKPAPLPVPETLVRKEPPQPPVKSFPPVTDELKTAFNTVSSFGSISSKVKSSSSFSSVENSSSKVEDSSRKLIPISELRSSPSYKLLASELEQYRPLTPSKLTGQTPSMLPYYQQNIGEIPLAHRPKSPLPHQIKAPMIHPSPPPPQLYKQPSGQYGGTNTVQTMKNLYTQKVAEQYQSQQIISQPIKQVGKGLADQPAKKILPALGYQPSPLAGKPAMPGDQNIPKTGTVPSNLDKTKQVFKPSIPTLNKPGEEQPVPWKVIREQPPPSDAPTVPWRKETTVEVAQSVRQQSTEGFVQTSKKESFGQTARKQSTEGTTQGFRKQSIEGPSQTLRKESLEQSLQTLRKQSTDQSASSAPWRKLSVESTPPTISQPYSSMSLPQTKQFGPQPPRPTTLPVVNVPPKPSSSTIPDAGPGGAPKSGIAGTSAPRWGRGLLNPNVGAGARIPQCGQCQRQIRYQCLSVCQQLCNLFCC